MDQWAEGGRGQRVLQRRYVIAVRANPIPSNERENKSEKHDMYKLTMI